VAFAHGTTAFAQEALTFQVLLANRTAETLAVVVVVHSLHPAISGFDGESASKTFRGKQLVPVGLTIRQTILQVEVTVSEQPAAVGASEALGVELLANGVQAITLDAFLTARAAGRQVILEAGLAVELVLLFDEPDVLQRPVALGHSANEMVGAPGQAEGCDEATSNLRRAGRANGDPGAGTNLRENSFTASGCRRKSGAGSGSGSRWSRCRWSRS